MIVRAIFFFAVLVGLSKQILLFYVKSEETKKVRAVEIEEGMVLTKKWEQHFSREISKLTKNEKSKHFKNIEAGGLTKKQVEIIRELFKNDKRYMVEVCNTFPLSPFLLLGAVISVITYSSFTPYINSFFNAFVWG